MRFVQIRCLRPFRSSLALREEEGEEEEEAGVVVWVEVETQVVEGREGGREEEVGGVRDEEAEEQLDWLLLCETEFSGRSITAWKLFSAWFECEQLELIYFVSATGWLVGQYESGGIGA